MLQALDLHWHYLYVLRLLGKTFQGSTIAALFLSLKFCIGFNSSVSQTQNDADVQNSRLFRRACDWESLFLLGNLWADWAGRGRRRIIMDHGPGESTEQAGSGVIRDSDHRWQVVRDWEPGRDRSASASLLSKISTSGPDTRDTWALATGLSDGWWRPDTVIPIICP